MEYFPAPLERLVEQFARLPGIGGKSAQRLAFFVLGLPEQDAQEFADSKYSFRNESDVGKYETVPMRVNLKSDRSVRYVKELIAALAEKHGLARAERTEEDFRYVEKKRKKK